MANADKDLIITPARNSAELDPYITFVGANTTTNAIINMFMYPDSNGTISFEGSAGQLFSITNDLSGVLYSINDELAVSQFNVSANGLNVLSANGGETIVGTTTKTANLTVYGALTANTLVVPSTSTANLTVSNDLIVGGNLTVSGTTTTINTQNLLANDSVILLNSGQSTALNDAGWILQRYSTPTISNYNVGFTWDENTDRLVVGRTQNQGNTSSVAYSNEWMTILGTNGYVGFGGNTNPVTTVTIDGPAYNALGITNSTSTSKKLFTFSVGNPGNYDDCGIIRFDSNVKLYFTSTSTNFLENSVGFFRYVNGSQSGNRIDLGATATNSIIINSFSGGVSLRTDSNTYPISFITNTIERMRVDGNGFIGIGTTTPAANLHVAGNGRFESGTTAGATVGQIGIKTTDGGLAYVGIQGNSWNALGLWAPSGSLAGNPGLSIGGSQITLSQPIGHYSSSITFNPRGDIGASAPGVVINSGGTGVKTFVVKGFASQTANLTEWQDSTGVALTSISPTGNLSIGTSTNSNKFNSRGNFIIETGSNNTRFYNNTYRFIFDSGSLNSSNDTGVRLTTSSTIATPAIILESNNAGSAVLTRLFSNESGLNSHEFNFQIAGYNGFKILKSENRETSVFMSPIAESLGAKLVVRNRWDGAPALRLSRLANTTTADILQVTDDTTNIRYMTIANTGNVGIATSSPASLLDVGSKYWFSGGAATELTLLNPSSNHLHLILDTGLSQDGTILFNRSGSTKWSLGLPYSTSNNFVVGTFDGGSNVMVIEPTGNVGINQTLPAEKLVVRGGNIRIETAGVLNGGLRIHTPNSAGANGTIKFGVDNVTLEKGIFWNRDDNRVSIINNASGTVLEEILTVAANSRVGIKTISPAVELDVNGIIKTKTYTVATLPAAATAGAGARAYVSDSNTTTYLSIVGGSGANGVLVFSNGTNWLLG